MNRFLPKTLTGQLILLLVTVLLISQVMNLFLLVGERRVIARSSQYNMIIDRMVEEAGDLPTFDRTDLPLLIHEGHPGKGVYFLSTHNRSTHYEQANRQPAYEAQLLKQMSDVGLSPLTVMVVRRMLDGAPRPAPGSRPESMFRPNRTPDPGGPPAPGMEEIILSAEIEPGIWLNSMAPHYAIEKLTKRAAFATGLMLLFTIAAIVALSRYIVKPINDLSIAADQFGRGEMINPIQESGPRDVRTAARAFNSMQARLTRLIETQRTILRAVGHDLRTPITSLRIRAEDLPEKHGRSKFISTLDDLTVMTEEILSWAKDASAIEVPARINLSAMLASIADDYADQGRDVSFDEPDSPHIVSCRRVALRRAIGNLIDNALKYGERACISISRHNDLFLIYIDDDGPGIPADRLSSVFDPFVRLEASRSRDTGGIGLGLSIAQSIIEAHGGTLILTNLSSRGLRVTLSLPDPNPF